MACVLVAANAAEVQWNLLQGGHQTGTEFYAEYSYGWGRPSISLGLSVNNAGSSAEFALTCGALNLLFMGNWLAAEVGDIVDETTTRNCDSYFIHEGIDDGLSSYGTIIVSSDTDFYLKFACAGLEECVYGWVLLNMDKDGLVSVKESAWDIDGGPMVVGGGSASPEPNTAALLVVGAAFLALRRKRLRGVRG